MIDGLPKVHLNHDWLTDWGGSEDVVRLMLECLPGSTMSATIDFLSAANRARLAVDTIETTFLQRAPFVQKKFWNYLPFTPLAVESLSTHDAAIVVSSSHAFAKGVPTHAQQLHVSYVHSPMRYIWDLQQQYLEDYRLDRGLKGLMARLVFHRLRAWDRQTANNVDLFLANSRHVQQRIWRTYRRPSAVLYPPVRLGDYQSGTGRDDFYLTVSRLVSYKKVGLIVDAFAAMPNRQLVVIGSGPEAEELQRRCPANVRLLGWQTDETVRRYLSTARAFVFAAHEDFGISPVEAQACGTPVIAYGVGGATETVRDVRTQDRPTGLLFPEQTVRSLVQAVEDFEALAGRFSPEVCRNWAEQFGEERFRLQFLAVVERAWAQWRLDPMGVEQAVLAQSWPAAGSP